MTSGSIHKHLLMFALPLILGNLFQQLYNTVDTLVVGNFIGKEALAAVGSTAQLINTLLGLFLGLATGGGIIVSQFFGARNIASLRKTVHTMVVGTVILGVAFTAIGVLFVDGMLRLMSTPADVFPLAKLYLTIYFWGILFLMLYNAGASILRGVGDSRHPLYFLVISSLVNVVLDLVFVIVFGWGVAGVAYATIISEAVSAALVVLTLTRTKECYSLRARELRISRDVLGRVLRLGLPTAFQMALTSFSNVFVQGYINSFGSDCMAGYAAFAKIDQISLLPMQSISISATTFVGQNYGAGNIERAKRGATDSLVLAMLLSFVVAVPMIAFAPHLIRIFNREEGVVYYGAYFMRSTALFYLVRCLNQVYGGALRGFGDALAPVVILLGSFVAFRQAYLFVATRLTDNFLVVALAYPVGWFVCGVTMLAYYVHYKRRIKPLGAAAAAAAE